MSDRVMCAQVITIGAGFHFIAGDIAFPICIALMVITIVADAWKRKTR